MAFMNTPLGDPIDKRILRRMSPLDQEALLAGPSTRDLLTTPRFSGESSDASESAPLLRDDELLPDDVERTEPSRWTRPTRFGAMVVLFWGIAVILKSQRLTCMNPL